MDDIQNRYQRPYRSRKERPCDACRKGKVLCDRPDGVPCRRCIRLSQACTFVQRPKKRVRSITDTSNDKLIPDPAFDDQTQARARGDIRFDGIRHQDRQWVTSRSTSPGPATDIGHIQSFLEHNEQLFDTLGILPEEMDLIDQRLFHHDSVFIPSTPHEIANRPEQSSPKSRGRQGSALFNRNDKSNENAPSNISRTVPHDSTIAISSETSLEHIRGAFSFYVGPTGASDAYLLYRQAFLEDSTSQTVASGLRFRLTERFGNLGETNSNGGLHSIERDLGFSPPTLFGITDHSLIDNAEPRAGPDLMEKARSDLWHILERDAAWRLVRLYVRFVEPQFPILSEDQIPQSPDSLDLLSLALVAGICATALPFLIYDEALYMLLPRPPSSNQLYQICWLALWQEFHAPTLATLQACLILQHRFPSNPVLSDTAFKWTLMSSATAVAQTIGLHRDPSNWQLVPLAERRLRRRLWWALLSMEKWYALARGMPSHLHEDEFDVEALVLQDLENCPGSSSESKSHFLNLVGLTNLLSDIQKTFYTVRGSRATSNDLHASLEAAKDIRVKLQEWNDSLPTALRSRVYHTDTETRSESTSKRLDANASLHLSYIVTHMALFRALLRPLEFRTKLADQSAERAGSVREITSAVVKGALLCVKELVEFMEGLTGAQWNAFWHSWSRPNFAIAGSFMVHLLQVISLPKERFSASNVEMSGADNASYVPSADHSHPVSPGQQVPRQQNDDVVCSTRADPCFEVEFDELQSLIKRWRWANRMSVNNAAGAKGLTNLALFKVETLLASLGSLTLSVDSDESST